MKATASRSAAPAAVIDPISGATLMKEILTVVGPTPDDEAPDFPGVEIHANLLTGILNGELRSVPAGSTNVEQLLMLVAGLPVEI